VRALDPLSRDKERAVADWIGIGPVVDGHARLTVACQPIASRSKPASVVAVDVVIDARGLSPAGMGDSPRAGHPRQLRRRRVAREATAPGGDGEGGPAR
jgi:hypothetical protein